MANINLIKKEDIAVSARIIDFVTSFPRNWEALQEVLGISRPIKKVPGTTLKMKYATGSLNDKDGEGNPIGEGDFIPRSKYTVAEKPYTELTIEKYSKEVSLEAIVQHGYDAACGLTDEEFMVDLQNRITDRFYTYLKTGTLTGKGATFQMAVAKAIGSVKNKFKTIHRTATGVAVFVNLMDVYEYIGSAEITTQTAFGLTYLKNFLGADIMFLCGDNEVAPGQIIATPLNNIIAYYADPSDPEIERSGLAYYTDGETNMIGIAIKGDFDHATSVTYAVMGFVVYAEYIDAVAVFEVGE